MLEVIARASHPCERAGSAFEPVGAGLEGAEEDAVQLGCGGDRELFLRILEQRGEPLDRFREGLREVRVADTMALPDWALVLLHWPAQSGSGQGLFGLWQERGAALLQEHLAGLPLEVAPAVVEQRVQGLVRRLRLLCQATLDYRFSLMDACYSSDCKVGASLAEFCLGENPQWENWLRAFQHFPGLGRVMAMVFDQWLSANRRLFDRLAADQTDLRRQILQDQDPGPLAQILTPSGADPHNGGEQVQFLIFQSGARLVYKPRDLRLGALFLELLELWPDPEWKQRRMLARADYSWEQFLHPDPCSDPKDCALYFHRLGVLAGLGELLNTRDLHRENLVAVGSAPHILDLETVVHPFTQQETELHNIVQSCMLAHPFSGAAGYRAVDLGVLAGTRRQTAPFPGDVPIEPMPCLPKVADPSLYFAHLEEGNRDALNWLESHRRQLQPLLDRMSGHCFRYLYRNTDHYVRILVLSLRPDLMRSGTRREAYLEQLFRPALALNHPFALAESEIHSLRNLDVPLFRGRIDQDELICENGQTVPGYFCANFTARLRPPSPLLSPSSRQQQARLLRSALGLAHLGANPREENFLPQTTSPPVSPDWLALAVELGELVLAAQRRQGPLAQYTPWSDSWKLDIAESDLLTGRAGWSVVCAELARHSGESRFAEAALEMLQQLSSGLSAWRHKWAKLRRSPSETLFCGAYHGLGGQLYALYRCGQLLEQVEFVQAALEFCRELPLELCLQRCGSGLALGTAGLVPVLLQGGPESLKIAHAFLLRETDEAPIPAGSATMAGLPDGPDAATYLRNRAGLPVTENWGYTAGARLSWLASGLSTPDASQISQWLQQGDPLETLELAFAAHARSGQSHWLRAAENIALSLVQRRHSSQNWFGAWKVCDEHHPCALTGCGALSLAFLRLARPGQVGSLRLLELPHEKSPGAGPGFSPRGAF